MVEIWMDVDTAVTVPVNILPLIALSDFKTVLDAETYNEAGLELIWNFVTAGGVQTHVAVTPTDTGGAYDWVNVGHGMYNIEIPASGGASANNDTEGFGWFSGKATDALPWRGPIIGFRRAALNDLMIEGGTASTNLEDFFDGTGYAGGTIKLASDATLNATQGSYAPAKAGDAMTLTAAYDAAKTAAPTGAAMTLTSAYDAAKTAAQAGNAMALVDDAITASKYDESTAFPVKSADTGSTAIARTGADSDTLETLSDQIDGASTFNPASDAVTLAALQGLYAPAKAGDAMTLTEAYDAAKTAAAAGAKMDIVDAPNATGLAAIADAFLKRDWTSVTGEATRSVLNALRPLLNKWTSASGAGGYVVKKEDDSTTAWTGTLTVDENGNISGMDHD